MARRSHLPDPVVEIIPGRPDLVVGGRLVDLIDKPLRALRASGALPAHGNRQLFADHIVIAHLVAFFNPVAKSLRRIEDVFQSPRARRRFDLPRVPRSTLSDAQALFDPALLRSLIDSLSAQVRLLPHDARLDSITRQLMIVDGTFFAVASRVAWALYNRNNNPDAAIHKGGIRVDVHFDLLRGTPHTAIVSGHGLSEQDSLAAHVEPECFYVLDRGYQSYALLGTIITAKSDFLVRIRKELAFDVVAERPLNAEDCLAGIVADTEIRIRGRRALRGLGKEHTVRRVEVRVEGKDDPIILLTNRMDISADIAALIYRHRWQVELFFRWLKCMANFKHFYSESQAGVTLQVYAAIIGTLLIAVQTGTKPNGYTFSTLSMVVSGMIGADEAPAIIARRMAICARDAETQRARAAKKKLGR
jgi:hypothetical protein